MELKVESKVGRLCRDICSVYGFLSDCNNFERFSLQERVTGWRSDSDSCGFTLKGIGDVNFRIVERRPGEMIKFAVENDQAENMFLWVQMKTAASGDTCVKLTTKLEVNPMMKMLVSKATGQREEKATEG